MKDLECTSFMPCHTLEDALTERLQESVETQSQTDIIDRLRTTSAPHLISSTTNKQPLKSDSHPSLAGWLRSLRRAAAAQDNIAVTL